MKVGYCCLLPTGSLGCFIRILHTHAINIRRLSISREQHQRSTYLTIRIKEPAVAVREFYGSCMRLLMELLYGGILSGWDN